MFSGTKNALAVWLIKLATKIAASGSACDDQDAIKDHESRLLEIVQPNPPQSSVPKLAGLDPYSTVKEPSSRWVMPYVIGLCIAAIAVTAISTRGLPTEDPILLFGLAALVFVFAIIRISVLGRATISPDAAAGIALAVLGGPLAVVICFAVVSLIDIGRRAPLRKCVFNFGGISLAQIIGGWAFTLIPIHHPLMYLTAGLTAGIATYLVSSFLLSVAIGLRSGNTPLQEWKENFQWMSSHFLLLGLVTGAFILGQHYLGAVTLIPFTVVLLVLWQGQREHVKYLRTSISKLHKANQQLRKVNARLQLALTNREN